MHLVPIQPEGAVAARRLHRGEGGLAPFGMVVGNQGCYVNVSHTVAVGEAEGVVQKIAHPSQASTSEGGFAGIHQGHFPGLGITSVDFHMVEIHVECYIAVCRK